MVPVTERTRSRMLIRPKDSFEDLLDPSKSEEVFDFEHLFLYLPHFLYRRQKHTDQNCLVGLRVDQIVRRPNSPRV